jgi:RNA recognition motif-containing protein
MPVLDHEVTVYVANLPWQTTEDDLARLFGQFADIVGARVIQDRRTGRSQGYGFVELALVEQVGAVCATLNGCQFNGRCLEVRPARPKPVRQ